MERINTCFLISYLPKKNSVSQILLVQIYLFNNLCLTISKKATYENLFKFDLKTQPKN